MQLSQDCHKHKPTFESEVAEVNKCLTSRFAVDLNPT